MKKPNPNVIVDSSALVALVNAADADHSRALTLSQSLRHRRCNLLVPRDILIETLNVVSKKIDRTTALTAAEVIRSSDPFLVVDVPEVLLEDALTKWSVQSSSVSLTDCIVMACAEYFETKDIFGFDEVFRKNGYHLPQRDAAGNAA